MTASKDIKAVADIYKTMSEASFNGAEHSLFSGMAELQIKLRSVQGMIHDEDIVMTSELEAANAAIGQCLRAIQAVQMKVEAGLR